jgi:protease IV
MPMPDMHDPNLPPHPEERPPLTVIPVRTPPRPVYASPFAVFARWIFRTAFLVSIGLNFFLFLLLAAQFGDSAGIHLSERYHSGHTEAHDKIAIVRVDGPLLEGFLAYAHKQIEQAAADSGVKAIVLRINSPGGTITASDELYRRLVNLREGTTPGHPSFKKPIVVSMASLTASGGYYIAMPAERLVAERTTLTGSIGVYAAFPNFAGLAKKYGFEMETIKAGGLKDSGSMFKEMKPQERQVWQDMVDHAYAQFLTVVEEGRPMLKGKLKEPVSERMIPVPADGEGPPKKPPEEVKYVRQRADGGIFTADKALLYGLVDQIGYLEDAVKEASKTAGLGDNYRAFVYEKPQTLLGALLQTQSAQPGSQVDFNKLAASAAPRLWYLAPQSDLAPILTAFGRE